MQKGSGRIPMRWRCLPRQSCPTHSRNSATALLLGQSGTLCVCVCIYIYICVCVCVCVYIYIYNFERGEENRNSALVGVGWGNFVEANLKIR
jgi:hypothetical protein